MITLNPGGRFRFSRALEASENWTKYPVRSAGECSAPWAAGFFSAGEIGISQGFLQDVPWISRDFGIFLKGFPWICHGFVGRIVWDFWYKNNNIMRCFMGFH